MRKIDLENTKSILIFQTAFLGDIALALPLPQVLKGMLPNVKKIYFVTTPIGSKIAELSPYIDEVIVFDKRGRHKGISGILELTRQINTFNIELAISLHRSLRTSLTLFKTNVKHTIGYDTASLSFLYSKRNKYRADLHEIQRNLSFIQNLSMDYEIEIPIPKINIEVETEVNKKLILIAPGSVWATKRWLPEHFRELSQIFIQSGYEVKVIGGKEDFDLGESIAIDSNIENLCGKNSIKETLVLMKKSALVISNDSAPTHFAYLANTPVVAIFGATSPIFGFAPSGKFDQVAQIEDLDCRPCEIHGGKSCPIGTFKCMVDLPPNTVFQKAMEVIESYSNTNYQTFSSI